jgi:poly-gamma-glutamate capsule biosynthesis protein CapA/YwtB (metallophosphatase superfamily)
MNRRRFLMHSSNVLLGSVTASASTMVESAARAGDVDREGRSRPAGDSKAEPRSVTLFLCGDVMTGRGIDQILPHPGNPQLYEPYMRSALGYVEIAEAKTGPIRRPVDFAYVWGDTLAELEHAEAEARIINLETAVTSADDRWRGKEIHYRMHPANAPCLSAAKIDCCVLANNHVLDWGYRGLAETLDTLHGARIRTAGAGPHEDRAAAPAIIELRGGRRVLVFAFGMSSAGVPHEWAAAKDSAGVNYLSDLSVSTTTRIARRVEAARRAGDIVVGSIHWGGNWGYDVSRSQRDFAHRLVDHARMDVVHGHSSHHPKGIEVYHERLILYGCGDFLNDYEGIGGHESFRPDLTLAYFPTFDTATGRLTRLLLTAMQIRHFRVNRARQVDVLWVEQMLSREGRPFGTRLMRRSDNRLELLWS